MVGPRNRRIAPIHPGEILKAEFLDPLAVTAYRLAKAIGASLTGSRPFSPGGVRSLPTPRSASALFFAMPAEFRLALQQHSDLDTARTTLKRRVDAEVEPLQAGR